ncbi:uncharacterized protein LY89DRAFT_778754 [Mollisia scopiformis]|uniref:Protein BTN n=1 Tax=Mollisia scopiformis TaxID=149040 RepID=A0A194XLT2_MOLSC|nr:uncharacterized protein LY89DRAFT_778754 [Mollisia scopiformis]KUJ21138.1 hypothetical protein LY89DRAFT_778754 [Mollisia scopiformis]
MEAPAQALTSFMNETKESSSQQYNDAHLIQTSKSDVQTSSPRSKRLRLNRTTIAFFIMGILIALPTMVVTMAANQMFAGITGVYGISLSLTAAITSFSTPLFARFLPYNICTFICVIFSLLSYTICTLPFPSPSSSITTSKAGPVLGTMFAGFVYAFGTNTYLAVAAFFPQEAVLALSVGSGFAAVLGPATYMGFMVAFGQDWRRSFLVFLPTVLGILVAWWVLMNRKCREAAKRSRLGSRGGKTIESMTSEAERDTGSEGDTESATAAGKVERKEGVCIQERESDTSEMLKTGFSPHRTRLGLLFQIILPKYVAPLIICTTSAVETLARFREAPKGDLQFQISSPTETHNLSSAPSSLFYHIPFIWTWTILQLILLTIGIIQLYHPFLTYYEVWVMVMFLVGGCVGGGFISTNYKVAEDFRKAGEPDEVRSFAMSYAGLGNFGGDALGGGLAVLLQQLVVKSIGSR